MSTIIKNFKFYLFLFALSILFSQKIIAESYHFKKYDFNSGLTDNHVIDQVLDKNSFIWIATAKGLNKFDGYNYVHYTKENLKLPDNHIRSLALNDTLLYAATHHSITCINIQNNNTFELKISNRNVIISKIFLTSNKLLVVYYEDGMVYFFNKKYEIVKKIKLNNQNEVPIAEANGKIFFLIRKTGVVAYDLNTLQHWETFEDKVDFLNSELKYIARIGLFYVHPDGLSVFNTKKNSFESLGPNFQYITNIDALNDSILVLVFEHYKTTLYNINRKIFLTQDFKIPANAIVENINHDNDNILLGTNQGLIVFPMNSGAFESITVPTQISFVPRAIIQTKEGEIFYFTYNQTFFSKKNADVIEVINSNLKLSYTALELGKDIYIGTDGIGLFKMNKKTHQVTEVVGKLGFPGGIPHITSLCKFSETKIIVGALQGLYLYDIQSKEISALNIYTSGIDMYKLKYGFNLFDLHYRHISAINNEIWCATNKGVVIFDRNFKFVDVINRFNTNTKNELICDSINYIYQNSKNEFWFATDVGFQQYNRATNKFGKTFDKSKILSNTKVLAIIPDQYGRMWMPTYYGLLLYNPSTGILTAYHQHDGLVNEEYNYASFAKLQNSEIILGGINGYQLIRPSIVQQNNNSISLHITDILKLDNSNEFISVNDTKKIILNLDEDFIQIRFSTNQFYHTESLSYYYRADENSNWISTNNVPIININSLPRNTSYLYIKVVNNDNLSEHYTAKIPVYINVKIYKEWWFIPTVLFMFLLLISVVLVLWLRFSNIKKMEKNRMENESILVQNLNKEKELNSLKSKFIRLISHEYRTPLTGITTSIDLMEMLLTAPQTDLNVQKEKRHMRNIRKQVDRMSKLIKGVQSLNRMETFIAKMNLEPVEIKSFITYNLELLLPSDFKLSLNVCEEEITSMLDKDILQHILSNIISNSVKYSFKERKELAVTVNSIDDTRFSIVIQDYGVGIPSKDMPYIFDTFYRSNEIENIQGIGLGLSITKQLTEELKGEIDVQSASDFGTTVTLVFKVA